MASEAGGDTGPAKTNNERGPLNDETKSAVFFLYDSSGLFTGASQGIASAFVVSAAVKISVKSLSNLPTQSQFEYNAPTQ